MYSNSNIDHSNKDTNSGTAVVAVRFGGHNFVFTDTQSRSDDQISSHCAVKSVCIRYDKNSGHSSRDLYGFSGSMNDMTYVMNDMAKDQKYSGKIGFALAKLHTRKVELGLTIESTKSIDAVMVNDEGAKFLGDSGQSFVIQHGIVGTPLHSISYCGSAGYKVAHIFMGMVAFMADEFDKLMQADNEVDYMMTLMRRSFAMVSKVNTCIGDSVAVVGTVDIKQFIAKEIENTKEDNEYGNVNIYYGISDKAHTEHDFVDDADKFDFEVDHDDVFYQMKVNTDFVAVSDQYFFGRSVAYGQKITFKKGFEFSKNRQIVKGDYKKPLDDSEVQD